MVSAEVVEVKPHKAAPKVKATKVFLNKIKLQMFNKYVELPRSISFMEMILTKNYF